MSGSIGNLFATVTADASQFIAEFNRAENQTRRSAAQIGAEVDKLGNDVRKKFSASKLGGDFLKGIGIGSSFQAINLVVEKVTDHYREQAELAERILKLTERTNRAVEARFRLRRTDEEEIARLDRERTGLQELLKIDIARGKAQEIIRAGAAEQVAAYNARERTAPTVGAAPFVREMQEALRLLGPRLGAEKVEELRARIEELSLEMESLGRPGKQAEVKNALTEFFGPLDLASKEALEALKTNREDIGKAIAFVDQKLRGDLKAGSDAFEKRRKDAAAAAKELEDAQVEYARRFGPDYAAIKEIDDVDFSPVISDAEKFEAQMYDIFERVGDNAASAFADMILEGENAFKSLATVASRAILETFARLAIVNPILNWMFPMQQGLPTLFSVFGFASGGRPPVGRPSLVGERGPELFVPDSSGVVVPNNRLSSAASMTDVTNITYNIQAGVTRAELIPILKQHAEITIAEGRRRERLRK